jgi:hypothetical protein
MFDIIFFISYNFIRLYDIDSLRYYFSAIAQCTATVEALIIPAFVYWLQNIKTEKSENNTDTINDNVQDLSDINKKRIMIYSNKFKLTLILLTSAVTFNLIPFFFFADMYLKYLCLIFSVLITSLSYIYTYRFIIVLVIPLSSKSISMISYRDEKLKPRSAILSEDSVVFLSAFKVLENKIAKLGEKSLDIKNKHISLRKLLNNLYSNGIVDKSLLINLDELINIRNILVHSEVNVIDNNYISVINSTLNELKLLEEKTQNINWIPQLAKDIIYNNTSRIIQFNERGLCEYKEVLTNSIVLQFDVKLLNVIDSGFGLHDIRYIFSDFLDNDEKIVIIFPWAILPNNKYQCHIDYFSPSIDNGHIRIYEDDVPDAVKEIEKYTIQIEYLINKIDIKITINEKTFSKELDLGKIRNYGTDFDRMKFYIESVNSVAEITVIKPNTEFRIL